MFALRQPEYTGENRCLPCTVVNAVIAVVAAALLAGGLAWTVSESAGLVAGAAFLVVSALSIWLRGYLVPGTPELTRRHLPDRVLEWFGKAPAEGVGAADGQTYSDLEATLANAGVLKPCPFKADLCLTGSFKVALRDALDDEPEEVDRLLEALSIDPSDVSLEEHGDGRVLRKAGRRVTTWPSAAALSADVGIATVLPDRVSDWTERSPLERSRLVMGTRLFLEECPDDGGRVELESETVRSCCSEREVIAGVCADSGDRLFEQSLE